MPLCPRLDLLDASISSNCNGAASRQGSVVLSAVSLGGLDTKDAMFRHSLRDMLSVQQVPSRCVSGSREEGILQWEHIVYFAVTEMINLWPPVTPSRSGEATETCWRYHDGAAALSLTLIGPRQQLGATLSHTTPIS